jgi:hypothetical protein
MRDPEDPPEVKHESFGMLALGRRQSTGSPLFGSDLIHQNLMAITLKEGKRQSHLSQDWYHAGKTIAEIEISQTQFAEFITGANQGDGIPCTIRYAYGKHMEPPPIHNQIEMVKTTFKNKLKNIDGEFEKALSNLKTMMDKPSIGKRDREEILNMVAMLRQSTVSNLPFVQEQFNEACASTVNVAKMELEAHKNHIVRTIGEKALKALNEGGSLSISMATQNTDDTLDSEVVE